MRIEAADTNRAEGWIVDYIHWAIILSYLKRTKKWLSLLK